MSQAVHLRLLGIVAHRLNGVMRRRNSTGIFRRNLKFSVRGADRSRDHTSIRKSDVQRLRRNDAGHRVPRNCDVAGKLGLDEQRLGLIIGLDDRAGQAISVLQRHLVRV